MLSSDILLACELTLIGTLARAARTLKRALKAPSEVAVRDVLKDLLVPQATEAGQI